jgi:predicted nucleic acid-binding protein
VSEMRYLLDTSALLSLIEDESGADRVEEILRREKTILPWVALLEVYYISLQEQGELIADQRLAMLKQVAGTILWQADEPTLLQAARFKARHRISFADAIISAFAVQSEAILVHKDPEYEVLIGQVNLEALPYKV